MTKPTVCLNMIVKNESKVIERCLNSLKDHIDYWVIADTGSTDDTKEKIQRILKDVPGELWDIPWQNFAFNRTAVLKAAKGKCDYNLIIDADETFNAKDDFKADLKEDCISGNIRYLSGFEFGRVMFLKDHCDWHYKGVVHNYAFTDKAVATTGNIYSCEIIHHCDGFSHGDERTKYLRNVELLTAELERDPTDTRSAFYIGESYRDAQEPEKAIEAYKHRISMGGWEEEVFWCYYQIALANKNLESFFDAYEYRSTRAEPMFVIAVLFYQANKINSARLIFEQIVDHPVPQDTLFSDTSIYIWKIKDFMGLIYYKLGMFKIALEIYNYLLTVVPETEIERTKANVQFCIDRLGEMANAS